MSLSKHFCRMPFHLFYRIFTKTPPHSRLLSVNLSAPPPLSLTPGWLEKIVNKKQSSIYPRVLQLAISRGSFFARCSLPIGLNTRTCLQPQNASGPLFTCGIKSSLCGVKIKLHTSGIFLRAQWNNSRESFFLFRWAFHPHRNRSASVNMPCYASDWYFVLRTRSNVPIMHRSIPIASPNSACLLPWNALEFLKIIR